MPSHFLIIDFNSSNFDLTTDISERLAKQRLQLNARLGLDVAATLGVDLTSVYSNEDLCLTRPTQNKTEVARVS